MPHSGKLSISKASGATADMMNDGSRFQVKMVGAVDADDSLPPETNQYTYVYDTRYQKSMSQLTRDVLPNLDNYRDLMSVHAIHRPTPEELLSSNYTEKVCVKIIFLKLPHVHTYSH